MWIEEMELSIKSIDILQKANIYLLEDIIERMISHPVKTSLALAKIKPEDFVEITEAIKEKQQNI